MSARASCQPRHTRTPAGLRRAARAVLDNLHAHPHTALVVVAVALFLGILQNVMAGDILRLDYYAYRLLVVRLRRSWLTPLMQSLSELALPVVLLVMVLAVQAFVPGRLPGLCAALNLVGVVALNQACKFVVQRPRPEGFRLIAESGYSFPSGHSMVAMAFYGLLAWMAWHYEQNPHIRRVSVTGFCLTVVLIGLSRIYLGVHYASDVMAGFCLAAAWLAFFTKVVAPAFLPEAPPRRRLARPDQKADRGVTRAGNDAVR